MAREPIFRDPKLSPSLFIVLGPPIFSVLFCLASSINANSDPLYEKITETVGIALSLYGLLTAYFAGLIPSLLISSAYSKIRQRTIGYRLVVPTIVGSGAYCLVCVLVLSVLYGGEVSHDAWSFAIYAAGAGAISTLLCALIVEAVSP
jgi:hypothetical protein